MARRCADETTATTSYTYDADGNQLTSAAPPPPGQSGDVTTTSTYDGDDELCWTDIAILTSPACGSPPMTSTSETTTYTYNSDGQQTTTVPPDGNASGSPSNYATTSTYNGAGELTSQTVPPPSGSRSRADDDELLRRRGWKYACRDRPERHPGHLQPRHDLGVADTTYNVYDEQDRELSTTDPSSNETEYTYDADGTVLTETEPSSTGAPTPTTGRGGDRDLLHRRDSDGELPVRIQRRALLDVPGDGLEESLQLSTGRCHDLQLRQLRAAGRLETNAAGATDTYGYDASSNLACVSYPNTSGSTCSASGTPTGVVRYTYNQVNQLTSLPTGRATR